MNTITIEKAGTVETLTIPDDAIDAVTAELTERFGKRDGFVEGQRYFLLCADGFITEITYSNFSAKYAKRGRVFHTKAEAESRRDRDDAQERLRKAYLAVTGGAEIEGREFYVPYYNGNRWMHEDFTDDFFPIPYRFATGEQAAAFGRDNGDDLMRMQTV